MTAKATPGPPAAATSSPGTDATPAPGQQLPLPQPLDIDLEYLKDVLVRLLSTPSPTGFTDAAVHMVCEELTALGVPHELTRRGAIRAELGGLRHSPDRAIIGHIDTLGAMVKALKDNGRLALTPVGNWSSRFAEGGRVTVFTGTRAYRGTVLPLKASGHIFDTEIDSQPCDWDHVEVRVDERADSRWDLDRLGIGIGDFIAFDANPDINHFGYINSRHLDDKAGVAVMLAVAKAVRGAGLTLPLDCHLLFTISEEVGSGASGVLHQDVAEMVTIDNGSQGPGQASSEFGVTVAMADSTGPFDYHLTRRMIDLCRENGIPYQREILKYYRCDSASAIEAGNDIRTALVCFGLDASHGYERIHLDALFCLAQLLTAYVQSDLLFHRDRISLGPMDDFPDPMHDIEDPVAAE